ncbi:MAG: glycosyltransferase family 2 protein [bacterium]
MRISAVIPCYNAERWIDDCLASVFKQTRPPDEVIVVDDGSTDASRERVASHNAEIRLLRTNRANAAGARNAGIGAATGDFIAFLDSDDYWHPHHLEVAEAALRESADVAYLAHNDQVRFRDGVGEPVERSTGSPFDSLTSGITDRAFFSWFSRARWFFPGSLVARRDRLCEIGGFDVTQVRRHDFEMFLRLIADRTWTYNPRAGTVYRLMINPGAISGHESETHYFASRALIKLEPHYGGAEFDRVLCYHRRALFRSLVRKPNRTLRDRSWRMLAGRLKMPTRIAYRLAFVVGPILRAAHGVVSRDR